jgi:hypothetical protein
MKVLLPVCLAPLIKVAGLNRMLSATLARIFLRYMMGFLTLDNRIYKIIIRH